MLQSEFENLIGRKITEEEYEKADAIYMSIPNITKQEFCADYKKHESSKLIQYLYNENETKTNAIRKAKEEKNELVSFLITNIHEYSSIELRNKVVAMIGIKAYIKEIIKRGYQLWDIDKEELLEIL